MEGQSLQVVELRAENIMRLKTVRIDASGKDVVILGGKNEQGKSSVLACIEMAVAGAKSIPDVPIRRGEFEGSILLDLGDIRIERTFDPSGSKLIVRNADGVKQGSPQSILDKLYSKVAFRPLEFSTQKPADQLATLKRIVDLDFTDLDSKRSKLYEERTIVGRRATDAEARINTFPTSCAGAPDEEVSIAALVAEKEAADESNRKIDDGIRRLTLASERTAKARKELQEAESAEKQAMAEVVSGDREDTAAIISAIAGAEETNRQVRAKKDRTKAVESFKTAERERDGLTKQIDAIDAEKAAKMKSAKWPIPGLGFGSNGVTLNGLPFEQASKAQRMKASLAIGMEQNPRLRVILLQDASLLDEDSMATVREFATDNNIQIWIERVGTGDAGALILEDGEIVEKVTPA
jgi:hypothetical protein